MPKILQHRRGRTSDLTSILGAEGEIFVDTSLVTIVVHDGVTTGGVTLARASVSGITIGTGAGQSNQQKPAIALGNNAGNNSQGVNAVAIGTAAGFISQSSYTIAIGASAGNTYQSDQAIALGNTAGQTNQGNSAIAMGTEAGRTNQSSFCISIGSGAGQNYQKTGAIAIGANAGATGVTNTGQSDYAIAIGYQAGTTDQANYAVALGYQAGNNTQSSNAIAVGNAAGSTGQGTYAIALGFRAGNSNQGGNAVAIGTLAGETTQSGQGVAIGFWAGKSAQGDNAVAIGAQSGQTSQGQNAIALGNNAGNTGQGTNGHAIGQGAGEFYQSSNSIAIGVFAGRYYQRGEAIAIGSLAGNTGQALSATAIGLNAGQTNQGQYSIALGYQAGQSNQCANTIVINASSTALNSTTSNALYINPIRAVAGTTGSLLIYDAVTKEVLADGFPQVTGLTILGDTTGTFSPLRVAGNVLTTNNNEGMVHFGKEVLSFNDTNIIMALTHNVNSYAQSILQNLNSSSTASADFVVNNNRTGGTAIYGDFGINSQNFTGASPFNDPDGTYLYAAGGSLSVGTLGAHNFKLITNDTARITIDSAGATTWTGNVSVFGTLTANTINTGTLNLPTTSNARVRTINYVIDGGGAAITTGGKGTVRVDFSGTITSWTVLADQSGSIAVDVWKGTYAVYGASGFSSTQSIVGTQKPTLTTSSKTTNITLTSWTTAVAAGDIFEFNVDTVSTVQNVTVSLKIIADN